MLLLKRSIGLAWMSLLSTALVASSQPCSQDASRLPYAPSTPSLRAAAQSPRNTENRATLAGERGVNADQLELG
jgi:hypothetical protein